MEINGSVDFESALSGLGATARVLEPAVFSSTGQLLELSSDGRLAASAEPGSGKVTITDVESGAVSSTIVSGQKSLLALMFSGDSQLLMLQGYNATELWDVSGKREFGHIPIGRIGRVPWSVFLPGDDTLLVAKPESEIAILHKNRPTARTLRASDSVTKAIAISPDGDELIMGGKNGVVTVLGIASGETEQTLTGPGEEVTAVAYSKYKSYAATASKDGSIRVWRPGSGKLVHTLRGHFDGVTDIQFSNDGELLASASFDKTARIWKVKSGELVVSIAGHTGPLSDVEFSPDDTLLLTVSSGERWTRQGVIQDDRTARVWNVATGEQLFILGGHESEITQAKFIPDATGIITKTREQITRIWQLRPLSMIAEHKEGRYSFGKDCGSFSNDGRLLAVCSEYGEVLLLTVPELRQKLKFKATNGSLSSVGFSPDGKYILSTAGRYGPPVIWNAADGKWLKSLDSYGNEILDAKFSSNGEWVVLAGMDGEVRLVDFETSSEIRKFSGHESAVWSVGVSSDMKRIVTSSSDSTARVWDVESGRQLSKFEEHLGVVFVAMFTPDGRSVVSGDSHGKIAIWNPENGGRQAFLTGHQGNIKRLDVSPDGSQLLSVSDDSSGQDKYLRLWSLEHRKLIAELRLHREETRNGVFSPDGKTIATMSGDGAVSLWRNFTTLEELARFAKNVAPRQLN